MTSSFTVTNVTFLQTRFDLYINFITSLYFFRLDLIYMYIVYISTPRCYQGDSGRNFGRRVRDEEYLSLVYIFTQELLEKIWKLVNCYIKFKFHGRNS